MKKSIRLEYELMRYVVFMIILGGCSSPQQTSTTAYKIEGYQKQAYKNIVVVSRVEPASYRRMIEDAIVKELKDRKYKVIASHNYFSREDLSDSALVISRVDSLGIDAALVVQYLGATKATMQTAVYNGSMYSIFGGVYHTIDVETRAFNMAYLVTHFIKRDKRELQWSEVFELNLSKGVELSADELAIRTRRALVRDQIL